MRTNPTPEPLIGLPPPGPSPWRSRASLFGAVTAFLLVAGLTALPQTASRAVAGEVDDAALDGRDLFPVVGTFELRDSQGQLASASAVGTASGLGVFVFARAPEETSKEVVIDAGFKLEAITHQRDGVEVYLVDAETLEQVATIEVDLPWSSSSTMTGEVGGAASQPTTVQDIPDPRYGLDLVNHRLFIADTPADEGGIRVAIVSLTREHAPIVARVPAGALMDGGDLLGPDTDQLGRPKGPLAYYPPEDVLYVGTSGTPKLDEGITSRAVVPVRVHEIDVGAIVEAWEDDGRCCAEAGSANVVAADYPDSVVNWSYEVPAAWCSSIIDRASPGVVRRSLTDPDLVSLVCGGNPAIGSVAGHVPVGSPGYRDGVVHIDLRGHRGASADPASFGSQFVEAPAKLDFAGASTDPASDLIALGATPHLKGKVFLYDAVQRAFRGNIPLLDDSHPPILDTATGRLYQSASDGQLITADTRPLAIPTGTVYYTDLASYSSGTSGFQLFDPSTRRLVVDSGGFCGERDPGTGDCLKVSDEEFDHVVFEDRRPFTSYEATDWDAATQDIDEAPGATTRDFSAGAKGFGARYSFVGGIEGAGVWSMLTGGSAVLGNLPLTSLASLVPTVPNTLQAKTNDVLLARVDGAALTGSTFGGTQVTAGARGVGLDDGTAKTLKTSTGLAIPQGPVIAEGQSWPEDYPADVRGHPTQCGDFGSEPAADAKPGSSVACDAGVPHAAGAALYAADRDVGTASALEPLVRVGDSEVVTTVTRGDDEGAVATAVAVVRNVELLGGLIRIGEARTEAQARAKGRPETAQTVLNRYFYDVAIGPPGEDPAFTCGLGQQPCDPYEVVRAVNGLLQPRVSAFIPPQDVSLVAAAVATDDVSNSTPGGARATVQRDLYDQQSDQADASFAQAELPAIVFIVTNNVSAPSRHVIQLAGVTLDAQYRINALPDTDVEPPPPPPSPEPPPALPEPPALEIPPDASVSARQVQLPSLAGEVVDPVDDDTDASGEPPAPPPAVEPPPPPVADPQPPAPPTAPVRIEPPPVTTGTTPAPSAPGALVNEPGPQAAPPPGPPSSGETGQLAASDQRLARQAASDGAPLATLVALALAPGYLALRRRLLRA